MTWNKVLDFLFLNCEGNQRAAAMKLLGMYKNAGHPPPKKMFMMEGDLHCEFEAWGYKVRKVFKASAVGTGVV